MGQTVVNKISFDLTSNRYPSVSVSLNKKAEYKLFKKDSGFVIQILNCSFAGPHLELPQFPTQEFAGFTVVTSKLSDSACEIYVGVESGFRIETSWKDGNILAFIPNQ